MQDNSNPCHIISGSLDASPRKPDLFPAELNYWNLDGKLDAAAKEIPPPPPFALPDGHLPILLVL